jgi:TolB protein
VNWKKIERLMNIMFGGGYQMRRMRFFFGGLFICALLFFFLEDVTSARIYIDINSPSVPKFNIAIPDFKNLGGDNKRPALSTELPGVVSNDLDLSGYFNPLDKAAFLEEKGGPLKGKDINFKDWSVIGAELLLKGGYVCVGNRLEVEIRLFDVFRGRQILGKRALGNLEEYRHLMHRLSNEIILKLTGHKGIFLTRLAYVGTATGEREIYACDYDGHNVRPLTQDKSIALLPRWSPDGKKIVYNSYKNGGPMLYLRDLVTGALRRLSGRSGLNIGACWAPDGKELVLCMSHKGNPDIFTIDLQGKILKQLVEHWGIDVSPAFSPDATRLAFVSNRSGSPQIYLMEISSGRVDRLTYEGKYNTSPAWSSLNRIVFVGKTNGNFDIFTLEPDGGRIKRLTADAGNNEDPCWSPDGRYIAFSSSRTGQYHIYIMNANGRTQRRVTFDKGKQTSPSWGPE